MTSFLDACGATGPLKWVVERSGTVALETPAFDLPFLVVGRDPRADLVLDHSDVSDRHLYLQVVAGHLFYLDLGSRAGTYVEGRRVSSGWVERQSPIRIGPYRLRLAEGVDERGPSASGEQAHSEGLQLALEVSHRSIRSSLSPLAGELVLVGSAADCQVRLLDSGVANYHCGLVRTPTGIWMVDLLGRGGVSLNGSATRCGRLNEGDELRLGDSRIRVQRDVPEPAQAIADAAPECMLPAYSANDPHLSSLLAGQPRERAELIEALLVPLVGQFGRMQQQVLDRLEKAEHTMARALAALQDDQLEPIRQELCQLREMTQELGDLAGHGAVVGPPRLGVATRAVVESEAARALPAPPAPDTIPALRTDNAPKSHELPGRLRRLLSLTSGPREATA